MKNDMIYQELDDINEITFIEKGHFDVGFELNKKKFFVLRFNRNQIGKFEVTYNRKSSFLIRAYTDCVGFFIRKITWSKLAEKYPLFFQEIDKKIYVTFIHKIWSKIVAAKRRKISDYQKRMGGNRQVIALQDEDIEVYV